MDLETTKKYAETEQLLQNQIASLKVDNQALQSRLSAAEKVVEAARAIGCGSQFKSYAPCAVCDALREYDSIHNENKGGGLEC